MMKISDCKKGDRVVYVPCHADGHRSHPDCEHGVVSSVNENWVFVKFDNLQRRMITGDEPYTAKATDAAELVRGY